MKSVDFSTGMSEFVVNGDPGKVIRINVADFNLPARLNKAGAELNDVTEKYRALDTPDHADAPRLMLEADAELRGIINRAFGTDVCTPAFGSTNCMTVVDADGTRLFHSFFSAFLPLVKAEIEQRAAAFRPRPEVEQYLDVDVQKLTATQKAQLLTQLTASS